MSKGLLGQGQQSVSFSASAKFYVDNTRMDVFEPDGSVLYPF